MTHVRHLSSKHYIPRVQYSTYIMYTQTQFILMLILRKVGGGGPFIKSVLGSS